MSGPTIRTKGSVSKAENIAKMFDDDGLTFECGNMHLETVCENNAVNIEEDRERCLVRYVFPDGSGIVVSASAWDIEGDEPFAWAGAQ